MMGNRHGRNGWHRTKSEGGVSRVRAGMLIHRHMHSIAQTWCAAGSLFTQTRTTMRMH